jgi:hypothetical protein
MGFWLKAVGIAVAVFAAALLLTALLPAKRCPGCGAALPKVRLPWSLRQALRGGHTCPACGCEIDAWGHRIG